MLQFNVCSFDIKVDYGKDKITYKSESINIGKCGMKKIYSASLKSLSLS